MSKKGGDVSFDDVLNEDYESPKFLSAADGGSGEGGEGSDEGGL